MPKEVTVNIELQEAYARCAMEEIRLGHYHVARGWLAEAIDARRAALDAERAARIVNVPILRTRPEDKTWLDRPLPVDPEDARTLAEKLGNRGPWRP